MTTFWNPDTRRMSVPPRVMLLGIILAAGVYLRLLDFRDPWPLNLHGYNGTHYSLIARNYVRYGYWDLRLVQFLEGGPLNEESLRYPNHPPLLPLLVSFSFKIFRTDREWSARLVPILFSVATLLLLYRLADRLWGEVVALGATFIMAVIPMAAYNASNVVYEPLMTFLALMTCYLYMRYLEKPTRGRWAALVLGLIPGALTDWPIFYFIPLFWLYSLRYQTPPRKGILLGLPVASVAIFAAVMTFTLNGAWETFTQILRSNIPPDPNALSPALNNQAITVSNWLGQVGRDNITFHTWPILILSAAWVAQYLWRLARGRATKEESFIGILVAFGATHVILGWHWVIDHVYWAALTTPGLAVATAAVCVAAYDRAMRWSVRARPVLAAAGILLTLGFAYICVKQIYNQHWVDPSGQELGALLQRNTPVEGTIVTCEEWDLPIYRYYADRNLLRTPVQTLAEFAALYNGNSRARYFVMPVEKQTTYKDLYELLERAFHSHLDNGLQFFELRAPKLPVDTIKGRLP